ncbi:hypothetical protein [Streptomyces sp. RTd22]|uniref:hypothetical protein n=1 Tax=Streptomyces sp. RTd22 TaxID=1841249 RepID=UPI0007C47CB8|nr:hypothetical protein [Streptomyces sp. RTd22]
MSAQPDHPVSYKVSAISYSINAIGTALADQKRTQFYSEVLAAEGTVAIDAVMEKWWREAMLDRAPGAEASRANASAGRKLVAVEDLIAQVERAAG